MYYQICWGICWNECFGWYWYLVKYVLGIILGVWSQKMFLQIHQGDTSHKLRGPFLGHSFNIFLIYAPKDSWRKMRRTCPPEKKFRIICGGYPSTNVLRYSQMTFSENNCERYSFFCPKSVWRNVCVWYFQTFLEVYFFVFRKNIS